MLVDKRTRLKRLYGLKNLTSSLLRAFKRFTTEVGTKPKLISTDFDNKIISGPVEEYLTDQQIKIRASPPYRQNENGLIERHWQQVVSMARNWLTSALLPSKFWFLAVKRACEIANIMPTKHVDGIITTPHELVYQQKPDFRQLFPLFSTSYIKQTRANEPTKINSSRKH